MRLLKVTAKDSSTRLWKSRCQPGRFWLWNPGCLAQGFVEHGPRPLHETKGPNVELLVSWVCRPPAGDRHPLWQMLFLFQNKKGRRVSLVHSDGAICRILGVTQDLFVFLSQERRGETGDDHVPFGKRVLGAAHRALYVTKGCQTDKRARCTHERAQHNVTHAGWRERGREGERERELCVPEFAEVAYRLQVNSGFTIVPLCLNLFLLLDSLPATGCLSFTVCPAWSW